MEAKALDLRALAREIVDDANARTDYMDGGFDQAKDDAITDYCKEEGVELTDEQRDEVSAMIDTGEPYRLVELPGSGAPDLLAVLRDIVRECRDTPAMLSEAALGVIIIKARKAIAKEESK